MFWLSMQPVETERQTLKTCTHGKGLLEQMNDEHSQFADVGEVDEGGFLCSHSHYLRGLHDKLPLLSRHHVGILFPHDVKNATQQLLRHRH